VQVRAPSTSIDRACVDWQTGLLRVSFVVAAVPGTVLDIHAKGVQIATALQAKVRANAASPSVYENAIVAFADPINIPFEEEETALVRAVLTVTTNQTTPFNATQTEAAVVELRAAARTAASNVTGQHLHLSEVTVLSTGSQGNFTAKTGAVVALLQLRVDKAKGQDTKAKLEKALFQNQFGEVAVAEVVVVDFFKCGTNDNTTTGWQDNYYTPELCRYDLRGEYAECIVCTATEYEYKACAGLVDTDCRNKPTKADSIQPLVFATTANSISVEWNGVVPLQLETNRVLFEDVFRFYHDELPNWGYKVQWERVANGDFTDAVFKDAIRSEDVEFVPKAGKAYAANFTELQPDTEYKVTVAMHNAEDNDAPTTETTKQTRTAEAPPATAPQNLDIYLPALTATSIQLKWTRPLKAKRNGVLTGYMVKATQMPGQEYAQNKSSAPVLVQGPLATTGLADGAVDSEDATYQYVFKGLEEHVRYAFEVAAINAAGVGPYGIETAKTAEIAPVDVPTITSVVEDTSKQLTVQWDAMALHQLNGDLEHYEVEYQRLDTTLTYTPFGEGASQEELVVPANFGDAALTTHASPIIAPKIKANTTTSTVLVNKDVIVPSMNYSIRVRAVIHVDSAVDDSFVRAYSAWSTPEYITTKAETPSAEPSNAAAVTSTSDTSTISLAFGLPALADRHGAVTQFTVLFQAATRSDITKANDRQACTTELYPAYTPEYGPSDDYKEWCQLSVPITMSQLTLNSLTATTNYNIRLAAVNSEGMGVPTILARYTMFAPPALTIANINPKTQKDLTADEPVEPDETTAGVAVKWGKTHSADVPDDKVEFLLQWCTPKIENGQPTATPECKEKVVPTESINLVRSPKYTVSEDLELKPYREYTYRIAAYPVDSKWMEYFGLAYTDEDAELIKQDHTSVAPRVAEAVARTHFTNPVVHLLDGSFLSDQTAHDSLSFKWTLPTLKDITGVPTEYVIKLTRLENTNNGNMYANANQSNSVSLTVPVGVNQTAFEAKVLGLEAAVEYKLVEIRLIIEHQTPNDASCSSKSAPTTPAAWSMGNDFKVVSADGCLYAADEFVKVMKTSEYRPDGAAAALLIDTATKLAGEGYIALEVYRGAGVHWADPAWYERNGILTGYKLSWYQDSQPTKECSSATTPCTKIIAQDELLGEPANAPFGWSYTLGGAEERTPRLLPYTNYSVSIQTRTAYGGPATDEQDCGDCWGPAASMHIRTLTGVPPRPVVTNLVRLAAGPPPPPRPGVWFRFVWRCPPPPPAPPLLPARTGDGCLPGSIVHPCTTLLQCTLLQPTLLLRVRVWPCIPAPD
jgi:hypothetical protein